MKDRYTQTRQHYWTRIVLLIDPADAPRNLSPEDFEHYIKVNLGDLPETRSKR